MIDNKISLPIDKNDIYCPITKQIFFDPVIISDGHTYEKEAILQWMQMNMSSPLNGDKLENKSYVQNRWLKNIINDLISKNEDLKKDQYKIQNNITLDDLMGIKYSCIQQKIQTVDRVVLSPIKSQNSNKFRHIVESAHSNMTEIINKTDFSQEHNIWGFAFLSYILSRGEKSNVLCLINKLSKEDLDYYNNLNTDKYDKPIFTICRKYSEHIHLLADKNIDFDLRGKDGESVLHELCLYANFSTINYLFENNVEKITKFINDQDEHGETPLFYACENENADAVIKYLVEKGADMSRKSVREYFVHKYIASQQNYIDINNFKYLIDKGLDVNVSDSRGNRPVHFVCKKKYISKELLEVVIGDPSNLYHENNKGETVLHILFKHFPDLDVVKYLLENKNVPYNIANKKGETPVHILCKNINENNNAKIILKYICSQHADALFMNINGNSPLDVLLGRIK